MKKQFTVSLCWLLLAVYFSFAAYQLGLTAGGRPGPGFFPFGAAMLIGAIAMVRLLRSKGELLAFATKRREWWKIVCVIVGMAGYALALEALGFVLCTFLLMALYLKLIAARSWVGSLGFALAVAVCSHLFFDSLLKAQLPRGFLAGIL